MEFYRIPGECKTCGAFLSLSWFFRSSVRFFGVGVLLCDTRERCEALRKFVCLAGLARASRGKPLRFIPAR